MLSSPNALDIMPKVGSRYEVALATSKRARQIADRRIKTEDPDITDPVDIASKELAEGTTIVEKEEVNVEEVEVDEENAETEEIKTEEGKEE